MLKITERMTKTLARTDLPVEDRTALLTAILGKLNALPIGDIVATSSDGAVMINGKNLDREQIIGFKEGIAALKDNFARKVIHEQVRFKAIEMGIFKSVSTETLMFSKAALWCMNEIEILLEKLQ